MSEGRNSYDTRLTQLSSHPRTENDLPVSPDRLAECNSLAPVGIGGRHNFWDEYTTILDGSTTSTTILDVSSTILHGGTTSTTILEGSTTTLDGSTTILDGSTTEWEQEQLTTR